MFEEDIVTTAENNWKWVDMSCSEAGVIQTWTAARCLLGLSAEFASSDFGSFSCWVRMEEGEGSPTIWLASSCFFHLNIASVVKVTEAAAPKTAASWSIGVWGWAESNPCLWWWILNASSCLRLAGYQILEWFVCTEKTHLHLPGVFWLLESPQKLQQNSYYTAKIGWFL